jgi:hypothetical protein
LGDSTAISDKVDCFTLGRFAFGGMPSLVTGGYGSVEVHQERVPRSWVQRDRLHVDAHYMSVLRYLEHRVERVRFGPAVCRRVDTVRNALPASTVRSACENRPSSLTGLDVTMDRMRFSNVAELLCLQQHPSRDGGARLNSTGSNDAPTANA